MTGQLPFRINSLVNSTKALNLHMKLCRGSGSPVREPEHIDHWFVQRAINLIRPLTRLRYLLLRLSSLPLPDNSLMEPLTREVSATYDQMAAAVAHEAYSEPARLSDQMKEVTWAADRINGKSKRSFSASFHGMFFG